MCTVPLLPPRALALALGIGLGVGSGAACGGVARHASDAPAVRGTWVRPSAAGADAALYFTLANPGRDTLVLAGVRSDAADAVTLHETMQMGTGTSAMTHMTPLARVAVPPHDSAAFAPLGRHAMLERLRHPLAVGDSVAFALAVVRAGRPDTLRATAAVRP